MDAFYPLIAFLLLIFVPMGLSVMVILRKPDKYRGDE